MATKKAKKAGKQLKGAKKLEATRVLFPNGPCLKP